MTLSDAEDAIELFSLSLFGGSPEDAAMRDFRPPGCRQSSKQVKAGPFKGLLALHGVSTLDQCTQGALATLCSFFHEFPLLMSQGHLFIRNCDGTKVSHICKVAVQSEAKRFMAALEKRCQLAASCEVSVGQLYALGDDINLAVPDMEVFIKQLNEGGDILLLASTLV